VEKMERELDFRGEIWREVKDEEGIFDKEIIWYPYPLGPSDELLEVEIPDIDFRKKENEIEVYVRGKKVGRVVYEKDEKGTERIRFKEEGEIPELYKRAYAVFYVNYNRLPIELLKTFMPKELSALLLEAIKKFDGAKLERMFVEDFWEIIDGWFGLPGLYDKVQEIFWLGNERDIYKTLTGFLANEILKQFFWRKANL
jgi:hypothetical protein